MEHIAFVIESGKISSGDEIRDNTVWKKMVLNKQTPDRKTMDLCIFHSSFDSDITPNHHKYMRCLEGIDGYGFCTKDYKVYDLCFQKDLAWKEAKMKHSRAMLQKMTKYDRNMEITNRVHSNFMINFEKRNQLIQKKKEMEKTHGSLTSKMEEQPEYLVLSQLVQKCEEIYDHSWNKLEAIYHLTPKQVTKEEFIFASMKEEVIKLERAKASLETWCNKYNRKPLTEEETILLRMDRQIAGLTKLMNSTFELPCVYMYKAIRSLDDLKHYFRPEIREKATYEMICTDLETCNKKYEVYQEFLEGKKIEDLLLKVEREQSQAAEEDRRNQTAKFVQTVYNDGLVVRLDGTVEEDISDHPKLIIGSAVTSGKIQDEQWRKLRT